MHIPISHLRKLFTKWFSLLVQQIGVELLQIWAGITNWGNNCESVHNNIQKRLKSKWNKDKSNNLN